MTGTVVCCCGAWDDPDDYPGAMWDRSEDWCPIHARKAVIEITVPTIPIAQPRQRQRVIGGKFAQNYTPTRDPVNAYKAAVQLASRQAYSGPPLSEPLKVDFVFVLPRPKGMLWKSKPMPRVPHAKKPDRDNLEKSTCDALNQLLWVDDSQICQGVVEKWIAAGDEQPHVCIRVQVIDQ